MNTVLWNGQFVRRKGCAGRKSRFARRSHLLCSALEPLENRLLLSTYVINGNQESVNSGAFGPITNPVVGTSGADTFIVENSAQNITINGAGGADTITDDTGTGFSVSVIGGNGQDTIIVRAPAATQADMDLNLATKIVTNGADTLDYSSETPTAVSLIGQLFASGDNLTVDATASVDAINLSSTGLTIPTLNGAANTTSYTYSTFHSLSINGNGGNDTFTVNSDSLITNIYDGSSGTPGTGTSVDFNIVANNVPLTLYSGSGTPGGGNYGDNYAITSNSGPLAIVGRTASNALLVNGNSSTIGFSGGSANNFTINANGGGSITLHADGTVLNSGFANILTVNANSGTLLVDGNAGMDSYTVVTNNGQLTINGGTGATTYAVNAPPVSAITINGNASAPSNALTFTGTTVGDAFTITTSSINAGTQSSVNYSNLTTIVINDSAGSANNSFLIQSDAVPTTINGSSGSDTFNIESNTAAATLTLNPNGGSNTLNLGSAVPATTGDTLASVLGNIDFPGTSGNDTINLYDTGDTTGRMVTLTPTTLVTSVTNVMVTYSGLMALNLNLDNDGNTLDVTGTAAMSTTTANLGTGANTVTVGSAAPATTGGVLDYLAGALDLIGSGSDTLTIDDDAGSTARTMTLDASTLTTVGLGAITYGGFNSLTINLATPPPAVPPATITNVFTVTTTNSATPTTINGGDQNDEFNIINDASALTINTGGGTDYVNINATGAATNINTQRGGTTIDNIGSLAPIETGGATGGIQGAITLVGETYDTVTVDDSADATANQTGSLSATKITGLGMVAGGITYSGLANLTINLGANGNTFTISDTSAASGTYIYGGAGADTITSTTNSSYLVISTARGNDTVTIDNTAAPLNVFSGRGSDTVTIDNAGDSVTVTGCGGADVTNVLADSDTATIDIDDTGDTGDSVNISSAAPAAGNLLGIQGLVTITGSGTTTLTIDDSTDTAASTSILNTSSFAFGSMSPLASFSGLSTLNINLGSGGNTLTVNDTSATTATNIDTGSGADNIQVAATTNLLNLNTGAGNDTIIIGSGGSDDDRTMTDIQGQVSITSNSNDTLILDDGNDGDGQTVDLYSSKYINDGGNWAEVDFSGLAALTLYVSSLSGDTVTVDNTPAGATTTVNAYGLGYLSPANTVTVDANSGPTIINTNSYSPSIIHILTTSANTTIYSNSSVGDQIYVGSTVTTSTATSNLDSIGANASSLTLNGDGADHVYLYDNASTVAKPNVTITGTTISGLTEPGSEIVYNDIDSLFLQLGTNSDTLNINSNATSTLDISAPPTAAVADVFNFQQIAGATTITAGTGGDTINVTSTAPMAGGNLNGIGAGLDVQGAAGSLLNIDNSGSTTGENDTITSSTITIGTAVTTYSNVPIVDIELSTGSDSLIISSTEGLTPPARFNINAEGGGGETQIESVSDNLYFDTGNDTGGGNDIYISSTGDAGGGLVSGIRNPITVTGHGSDSLTIDDSADANPTTTDLSSSQVQTLLHAVSYSGLSDLTFNLGTGGNTFNIVSSAGGTLTTVDTGAGTNVTTIGSLAPANSGGNLGNIQGEIAIAGQGTDTLDVDDSGSATADAGSLNTSVITLAAQPIDYTSVQNLNIDLSNHGTTFTVTNTTSGTNTDITAGTSADIFTVQNNAGPTTINTGLGNDTVTVNATGNTLAINNAGGSDTFDFGSAANGDTLRSIAGAVTIIGAGSDTLNLDDSGDTTGRTVNLSDTQETGASAASISYTGIGALSLLLGSGDDQLTIATTIAGPSTINAGNGNNSVTVVATQGPLNLTTGTGDDSITLETISNPTTVTTGDGNDSVVMQTINAITTVTSGNGNDTVQMDNINAVTSVTLGNGTDTVNLQANAAATNITVGTGTDVVNISSTAPTAGGTLNNITAATTITGGGSTTLNLDDTGSNTAKSSIFTAGSVAGLSPAGISYSGLSNLNVSLGSGVQSVTIYSTSANTDTTITAGSANDIFTFTAQPVTSNPGGPGQITNDVAYLSPLAVAGPITVDGSLGINSLTVDDSIDPAAQNVVLTPTTIQGIGSTITYLNFATLALTLGTASNLTVNGTNPGTATSVGGGSASGYQANLNYPGGFTGTVTLSNVNGGTISIAGDLLGTMSISGNLDGLSVTGNLSGAFSLTGNLGTLNVGDDLSGSATIGGNLNSITVAGDLSGTTSVGGNLAGSSTLGNLSGQLLVAGTIGDLAINNNLSGTLTAGSDVTNLSVTGDLSGLFSSGGTVLQLTVGGNLSGRVAITDDLPTASIGTLSGTLDVGGTITTLTISGSDSGMLTAGNVGTITLPDTSPSGAAGNLFSLTQGGIYRSIRAIADNGSDLSSLSANIFYEGSTLTPQAGIRLNNSNAANTFDLVLSASGVSEFNLEKVDSVNGARTGLFNLDVNGSLITPDSATSSYFGYGNTPAIDLPADHLGLVAVSRNMTSGSILASSIEGIAFATLSLPNGNDALAMAFIKQTNLLASALAINPATKKPFAQVQAPTGQSLRVIISPASATPVGVFTGQAKRGIKFAANALYFMDENSDLSGTLMADVSFSPGATSHGRKVVSNLTFEGDGGSIDTWSVVQNIHSDGWLGDLHFEGGYEKLSSITAPAIHGNINLSGGQLLAQLQTTGEEIDPITGAITQVSGDLGTTANGASTIENVVMRKGSSIVVRGDLIAKTVVDGNLLGNIDVSGDIDGLTHVLGAGGSSGQIISLGNMNGDIIIDGSLTGRIAAKGNISGNVTIYKSLSKTGAVIAGGQIGNSTAGTRLAADSQQGLIAAGGSVASAISHGKSKTSATISNADSNTVNNSELANIWTNGGNTLALDTSGTLDEAGLTLIQKDISALKANNGTLSGTTP